MSLDGVREWYLKSMLPARIEHAKALVPGDVVYTLRGLSQVVLVNNEASGIFVLVALFVGGGALLGTLSLVCTLVATLLARRVFTDVDSVKNGLAGYNACLVGCAFSIFVGREWTPGLFLPGIFCAVASSFVNLALKAFFDIPTYTFAFNLTIIAYVQFGFNGPDPFSDLPLTALNIILCPLRGVSQIWVVNSWIAGLVILVGIAIDSFGIALYALGGAIVGSIAGYIFGGDDALVDILNGLHGFNSCLMACAIAVFYVPSLASVCFGIAACIFTSILTLGLGNSLNIRLRGEEENVVIPAFTLPFCIVAAACHLVLRDGALKGLHGAISPISPDSNYHQHRIRMIKEEEDPGVIGRSVELGPTMRVFYGPSAITLKNASSNYLDRSPRVVDLSFENADLEESFSRHMGLHSRPHARMSSLMKMDDADEGLVRSAIVRITSTSRSGGLGFSSLLSSTIRPGGSSIRSSTTSGPMPFIPSRSTLERGPNEGASDTPDVESSANLKEMDDTSGTKDTALE
ncbi:hypothetical protein ACHAW5_001569 [Stephanodiscus triporus]|uniref:Urea transporter n=1 Tax=Stephanodiscus triporus TaxID=2934178 RepID=A0ABD3NI24_9STRA